MLMLMLSKKFKPERGAVLVVVLEVVHLNPDHIYVVIVIVAGDVEGYSARVLTQLVHD